LKYREERREKREEAPVWRFSECEGDQRLVHGTRALRKNKNGHHSYKNTDFWIFRQNGLLGLGRGVDTSLHHAQAFK
jgi:hypothetical protein